MVAKIVSGQSIRGLLNYNENKVKAGQATLIMANRFGTDIEKLDFISKLNRFKHLTGLNNRVKTNAIHVMLNFDKQDKLTVAALQQIAMVYMERIGFSDQPYLAYLHKDANHPHVHLVTTNIQSDGKRVSIHNIGKILSEPARKDIEKEFKLTRAEGRQQSELTITPVNIEKALYGKTPTKSAINKVVNGVISSYKFTSFAEYNAVLSVFGVRADRGKEDTVMFAKRGLIYSIIDNDGKPIGIPFKASLLSKKPLLDKVEQNFEPNRDKRKPFRDSIKKQIDAVLNKYSSITPHTFNTELRKSGIDLLLRKNEQGYIYGATFIDHKSKSVFNGSALGKSYSANAITERFGTSDKLKTYLSPVNERSSLPKAITDESTNSLLGVANQTNYLETLLGKPQTDSGVGDLKKRKRRKKGRTL
jgi:hypothetical protein